MAEIPSREDKLRPEVQSKTSDFDVDCSYQKSTECVLSPLRYKCNMYDEVCSPLEEF